MALIQQFRPAATVVWRVLRQGLDTGQRLLPVFGPGTPDIGSPEYYAERGYTPSGQKLESDLVGYASDIPVLGFIGPMPPPALLIAEGRMQQYVPAGIAAVLSSTQSGVGSSLPSKPKTPGKSYPIFSDHSGIFGKNGKVLHNPCAKGYYPKMVNGRAMCVKR